jgi:hypothetical protein
LNFVHGFRRKSSKYMATCPVGQTDRQTDICDEDNPFSRISLSRRAFQFTIYNGPTNALVCNKTLIQMSHTKTLKITPTCFDHQMIIIRELFDPSLNHWLKFEYSSMVMRQHTFIRFTCVERRVDMWTCLSTQYNMQNVCCRITTHEDSNFNQWF